MYAHNSIYYIIKLNLLCLAFYSKYSLSPFLMADKKKIYNLNIKKIIKKKDGIEKNLPWVEKYRPHQISDLISHKYIIETCIIYFSLFQSNFVF